MKKLITAILVFILTTTSALAQEKAVSEVVILEATHTFHNLVVRRLDHSLWLLHTRSFCSNLKAGNTLMLSVHGELNANHDFLEGPEENPCFLDQATAISGTVFLESVSANRPEMILNAQDKRLLIEYESVCPQPNRFTQSPIFIDQKEVEITPGDWLYLADNQGTCRIKRVLRISR